MSEEFLDVIKQGPVKIKGKRLGVSFQYSSVPVIATNQYHRISNC